MSMLFFPSQVGVLSEVLERVNLAASAAHRRTLQHPSIQKKEAKFGVE